MNQKREQLFETKPNLCFGSWTTPSPISSRTYLRLSDRNTCGSIRLFVRCSRKSERPSIVCCPINVRAHHVEPAPEAGGACASERGAGVASGGAPNRCQTNHGIASRQRSRLIGGA